MVIKLIISQDGADEPETATTAAPAPADPTAPAVPAGTTFSPVTPTALPHINADGTYAAADGTNFADTTATAPGTLPAQPNTPSSTTATPGQLPAPSWQAVTIYALLLGALFAFMFVGVEAGTALGLFALVGIIADQIRRSLS
ncbi:hypothetical protein [Streptomyces longisporus]|uniref:Uncharacterized protein n=1 Tax=Streptomyces longisporus TaxID=1948 RepID=A0ABN3NL61_STRLO